MLEKVFTCTPNKQRCHDPVIIHSHRALDDLSFRKSIIVVQTAHIQLQHFKPALPGLQVLMAKLSFCSTEACVEIRFITWSISKQFSLVASGGIWWPKIWRASWMYNLKWTASLQLSIQESWVDSFYLISYDGSVWYCSTVYVISIWLMKILMRKPFLFKHVSVCFLPLLVTS